MKETLTFYRKMANTNITIMKNYKSAKVNKMSYNDIINVYDKHDINLDEDITRLKLILNKIKDKSSVTSEPCEILTETSDTASEPLELSEILTDKSEILTDKSEIKNTPSENIKFYYDNLKNYISNNKYLPIIIPVLILGIIYGQKK